MSRPRRRTTILAVTSLLALGGILAGCSAGSGSASDTSAVQGAGGGAAAAGDAAAAPAADAQRQVIQTGDIRMTVDDPLKAADAVVALTEKAGGRIDDRTEHAATASDVGTAQLTVRLPAAEVTGAIATLRTLGTVDQIDLASQDVTGAAQDLDARIHGLQLSVARMEDLLSRATTSADVIAAEAALAERQTNLEQLQSERARLAEQVALSTLTIALYGPGLVATSGPDSFLDGLATGWNALVDVVQTLVVVLGVLLPWLVVGGAITAGVVTLVRRRRARRPAEPGAPMFRPGVPMPAGVVGPGPHGAPAPTARGAQAPGAPAPTAPPTPLPTPPSAPTGSEPRTEGDADRE